MRHQRNIVRISNRRFRRTMGLDHRPVLMSMLTKRMIPKQAVYSKSAKESRGGCITTREIARQKSTTTRLYQMLDNTCRCFGLAESKIVTSQYFASLLDMECSFVPLT